MINQITAETVRSFILSNEIPYASTQSKLCVPIIARICCKMLHGIKFDDIKVCDNLIIDGHHRYLSALITNVEINQVFSNKTSATKIINWLTIELDENDWDTPSKIAHLNKLDASYNDLEIEFVNSITM